MQAKHVLLLAAGTMVTGGLVACLRRSGRARGAQERAVASVVGAFVADAATMPLHWIYDNKKLLGIVGADTASPEFFATPSCPFYNESQFPGHYKTGMPSPYAEQGRAQLALAAAKGRIDGQAMATGLFNWSKSYGGRHDHALKEFIKNSTEGKTFPACGADDNQAGSFVKIPIAAVASVGTPQYLQAVEDSVRVTHNNDMNVRYCLTLARMLEKLITGSAVTIREALDSVVSEGVPKDVMESIRFALDGIDTPSLQLMTDWGKKFDSMGLACPNPQAFIASLHIALRATSFEDAVRANILLGGDNCSRSTAIGALFAACEGVPSGMESKTVDAASIRADAEWLWCTGHSWPNVPSIRIR